ncbi:hypothetical protein [Pedobacter sp. JY14-1]|uniref:hypothetical protein n=1 Tax=Pedobacter sp. JY14-1 TaxID=3034151 RepID=UPI0023E271D2|nr:hypothetical protein [Pedobacter sp. JY14-1]
MFKQFLEQTSDKQVYLITSLAIFILFFLLVSILLLKMSRERVKYMSELPLNETGHD